MPFSLGLVSNQITVRFALFGWVFLCSLWFFFVLVFFLLLFFFSLCFLFFCGVFVFMVFFFFFRECVGGTHVCAV